MAVPIRRMDDMLMAYKNYSKNPTKMAEKAMKEEFEGLIDSSARDAAMLTSNLLKTMVILHRKSYVFYDDIGQVRQLARKAQTLFNELDELVALISARESEEAKRAEYLENMKELTEKFS